MLSVLATIFWVALIGSVAYQRRVRDEFEREFEREYERQRGEQAVVQALALVLRLAGAAVG